MQFHWLLQWPMSSVSCLFVIKDNDGNKQVTHHGMALLPPSLPPSLPCDKVFFWSSPKIWNVKGSQITPGEHSSKWGNWSSLPWSCPKTELTLHHNHTCWTFLLKMEAIILSLTSKWWSWSGFLKIQFDEIYFRKLVNFFPKNKQNWLNLYLESIFFSDKNSQFFWAEKMTNSLWEKNSLLMMDDKTHFCHLILMKSYDPV